jgi:putative hemolysin
MDGHLYFEVGAIVLLVLANGFFALAEFSVIASRKSRLAQKIQERKLGAVKALKLHDNPENFLASIQVGITLIGSLVGVFSGATVVEVLEYRFSHSAIAWVVDFASPLAVGTVVVSITVLSVVLGELVPKYIALSHPERWARLVAGPITLFMRIAFVFTRALSGLAKGIIRIIGIKTDDMQGIVSEDEIQHMIIEGRKKGFFEVSEEEFVRSVFDFTDTPVRRAMRPRPDVVAIEVDSPSEKVLSILSETGYSRFPVYEDSIDKIVGVVYVKDLIRDKQDLHTIELRKLMREPFFVPDSMQVTRLLREFQSGKQHLAIVLDEYGGTAGIITLEDILEELVGEIQDEYDSEAKPIIKHSETVVYANGEVWPGDVNELINTHLPEDQSVTLAGLFIDLVGHVPSKNETIELTDARLTVLAKQQHRVLRLKIEKIPLAIDTGR